jgi:hypothetical protein
MNGDHGRPVFYCHAGCSTKDIYAALRAKGLWLDHATPFDHEEIDRRRRERKAREEIEHKAREAEAAARWAASGPIDPGGPVARYLASRGFRPPFPPSLRQGIYCSASGHPYPAMVAGACRYPGRNVVCAQITPLRKNGSKAWSRPARITQGRLPGAAVRLSCWQEGQRVVLTEGVEDALAIATVCPDVAAWAALGTGNAATVQLPHRSQVVLALDGDRAGRLATDVAAKAMRERGHTVMVAAIPDGLDPAALLLEASS